MPYADPKKLKEHQKKYHQSKKYKEYDWKRRGIRLVEGDYERYMETSNCDCCGVELILGNKSKARKIIDHDHHSGYVRNIICNTCNIKRRVIDTLKMRLHLELYRVSFLLLH